MIPQAQWIELAGLGHCPMLDDARLTAHTILALTRPADARREPSQVGFRRALLSLNGIGASSETPAAPDLLLGGHASPDIRRQQHYGAG